MTEQPAGNPPRPAVLGLWDAVSIIIGIVVGTSIFKSSPLIFQNVDSPGKGLLLWGAGGVLSLIGAFCFAELATAFPRSGGSYVYLTRAYGPFLGFQYGWGNLSVILAGNMGVMAFVFAEYALRLFTGAEKATATGHREALLAIAAVLVLTTLNTIGVRSGKTTQNILTGAKVAGLLAVVVAGLLVDTAPPSNVTEPIKGPGIPLAMILILYAYGGWSDAAFVAAEVRDVQRNIPRALILGIAAITVLYLLVNVGYLRCLGFEGLRQSATPAADALDHWLGAGGQRGMSLIVMASALGALNGLLFAGSRVNAILGADHPIFARLGRWDPRTGTPLLALAAQGAIAVLLIAVVGTPEGKGAIDRVLSLLQLPTIPWSRFESGFEALLVGTAPLYWLFLLLAGASLVVLRLREPQVERPFRVPLYPITPAIFCAMCGWMLWSSVAYAGMLSLIGFVPVAIGVPAYFVSERLRRK